jgi:hypothetical protein
MTDPLEDDFLSSLDAEISKVTEKSSLEARLKTLNAKVSNPRQIGKRNLISELQDVKAQLTAIQWKPISNVAFFIEQHCTSCNSTHRVFMQHMQRQVTTSGSKVDRLVRIPRPVPNYSNEVVIECRKTLICYDCADVYGFDLANPTAISFHSDKPISISSTYIQEALDVNIPETEETLDGSSDQVL